MVSPVSSCMYYSGWMVHDGEDQISAPELHHLTKEETKEKNKKTKSYKHVPHKDKPAQVVAKRNARERRRVQAVNTAFARLRKIIPVENDRGKRISKVKTLQYAIDYIQALMTLLEQDHHYHLISRYYSYKFNEDFASTYNHSEDF